MICFASSILSSDNLRDMPQLAVMLLSVGTTTAPQEDNSFCAIIAACGESNAKSQ